MKYHILEGVSGKKRDKKRWLLLLPVIGLIGGAYILVNVLWPSLPPTVLPGETTGERLVRQKPGEKGNRLYIPQINVDVAIVQGSEASTLERGAWWRRPESGNPKEGGNFVLSAHRFQLGVTPQETRAKSPFYHIDLLKENDEFFVDYQGTRYAYKVARKYKVDRKATEIERRSDEPKLTLYSCDLRGELAGREVIEAKPFGTVAWSDEAEPQIVPLGQIE